MRIAHENRIARFRPARTEGPHVGADQRFFLRPGRAGRLAGLTPHESPDNPSPVESETHDTGHPVGGDVAARDRQDPIRKFAAIEFDEIIEPERESLEHGAEICVEPVVGFNGARVDAELFVPEIALDVVLSSEILGVLASGAQKTAHNVEQMILGLAVAESESGGGQRFALDVGDAVGGPPDLDLTGKLLRVQVCGRSRLRQRHGREDQQECHNGVARRLSALHRINPPSLETKKS